MLRLLLNSEATKTNGAIKPCQNPSQKPATTPCSLAVPLNWLGPAAHPARMVSNSRTSTSKVREDFIGIPPVYVVTKHGHEKSRNKHREISHGGDIRAENRKQDARDGPRPLHWGELKSRSLFSLRSPRAEARGYHVSLGARAGSG